jgi:bla regulator protein blaR1
MMLELTNHLWQSTLFAVTAGLATLAFRKNRAQVRYWLWFSASVKFFVPLALLMSLGSHFQWAPAVNDVTTPAVSQAIEEIAQPFPETVSFTTPSRGTRDWIPLAIFAVWACGFAAIALIRFRGWVRIRAAGRASVPIEIPARVAVRASPGLLEPGVVGWLRPILLVPEGIADRLTPLQLEAVLAHELCHVRRRDNLTSAIHMIVEAIFWFHPLVWWIGARLVEERERACDEGVLSLGSEPQVYAEAILNVCKLYVESPLACISGVTGSDLKKRIEAIMTNRVARRLNFAKKLALALAGVAALAVPIVLGMMNLPRLRAQEAIPRFEVASIRLCGSGDGGGAKGGGRGGGGPGAQGPSPDRLNMNCGPVKNLIRLAYVTYATGHFNPMERTPIEGGPAWIDSDRYQITAKAEGAPGQAMMRGPMLQALLEDRFKLKVRRESREVPAYALTLGKNSSKLQPFQEGSCRALDFSNPPAPPEPGQRPLPICGLAMRRRSGPNVTWEVRGATLDDLARALGSDLDRIVINKTGIAGKFDLQMEFTPDETTAGLNSLRVAGGEPAFPQPTASDPPGGPSIFTAIQEQLGLKLESAKGPREFLVIDRVERPSEN